MQTVIRILENLLEIRLRNLKNESNFLMMLPSNEFYNLTNRLLDLASEGLGSNYLQNHTKYVGKYGKLGFDLLELLSIKNGFYAFESALHFFPLGNEAPYNLEWWNNGDTWKSLYKFIKFDFLCFAEDIFGFQFCISQNKIYLFDPETGSLEYQASDLSVFLNNLLNNYDSMVGYTIAHEWQNVNGSINSGYRLAPKIPFILGGEFKVSNLFSIESKKSMQFRVHLASQIKDLPEGAKTEFDIK